MKLMCLTAALFLRAQETPWAAKEMADGCYDVAMSTKKSGLTRRGLLKKGAATAAAGAAGLLTSPRTVAQSAQAPAVVTRRRFKAWISRGDGRGRTTLQEITLRPISGRQVVVRTEATNLCYSNLGAVLGFQPNSGA